MIVPLLALLLGLFGVPVLLITLGHRLRGRTEGRKRQFWGGVVGYIAGMTLAIAAMVSPPVSWSGGDVVRPFLVYWAMLLGGLLGVFTGPLLAWRRGGRPS